MKKFIAAILFFIGSLAMAFRKGKQSGKDSERVKAVEKELAEKTKHAETIEQVSEVRKDVSSLPGGDVERRLRDKYQRD
jgi:uncharacterized protein YdeI (BOF family)